MKEQQRGFVWPSFPQLLVQRILSKLADFPYYLRESPATAYTALYFTNLTSTPVSFTVSFIGDDGSPLSFAS
jgi:hypothetical protein